MSFLGHVHNGQINLDPSVRLPEGAEVRIEILHNGNSRDAVRQIALRRSARIRLDPDLARRIATSPEFLPEDC